jgi:alanine dehydrogenase
MRSSFGFCVSSLIRHSGFVIRNSLMALFLTEADVSRLVDMRVAVEVIEEAFRRMAASEVTNVPRARSQASGFVLHSMSAGAAYLGLAGWKNYTTTRAGARFHVGLYEQSSGRLVAIIEADRLGQLRTGAATGVAVQYMAPPEMTELGLFGTGHQAETQLAAVAAVRSLKQAFVYSRDESKREAFADRMSTVLNLDVTPVDRPQEAVEDLPLVVTATGAREPVFDGNWLSEGTLVCAVGSNWLNKAEIDSTTVRRADIIVCDSVEACRGEAGDFVDALEKGIFDWARAINLADVVAGRATGRSRTKGVTIFKSVGLAMEDIALGGRVLQLAREQGVGVELPI